ncbi:hypothetical protein HMPREF9447_00758 [Bacteroides oleiciplenus YIT 12058]|uniref:Uncharacterized protein n=1 Tax=Bacteroides oleiciplenus YIT 12058 TaxID=742727 RepID=K9E6P1_9BACE|nr:hypothetical protein HMPREF9447_00758 [Bacteroides oleiciplenus YIT 12058]
MKLTPSELHYIRASVIGELLLPTSDSQPPNQGLFIFTEKYILPI